jgi:hypothetical protein
MERLHFGTMLGKEVVIVSRILFPQGQSFAATIRGSEAGGAWLESRTLTDLVLKNVLQATMSEVTPVFFIPFSSIQWVFTAEDGPSISSEGIREYPT